MAFPVVIRALSILPLRIQYRVADFVSLIMSIIPNRTCRLINQNIQMCFPDQSKEAQLNLRSKTIKHTVYSAFEVAALWCWPAEKILARVTQENVCDNFTQSEKGRLVIVPHLGSWELLILWLAQQGEFMCLYKPQPGRSVDQFILEARSRNGAAMLPIDTAGLRQLSRGLKQGGTAMILPDQRPKKNKARHMSSFFGHQAPTTPLIHNLCKRIDCDVFIASIFRQNTLNSFELVIEALDHKILVSDMQASLDYMNRQIETFIRKQPEQYQWGYSRFMRSEYRSVNW